MSVSGRNSELELSPGVAHERFNLKWSAAYNEIEIVDGKEYLYSVMQSDGNSFAEMSS